MMDYLGVSTPPRCTKCQGYIYCNQQRSELSRKEQEVVELVKKGMTIDPEAGVITAKYPMNENYMLLEDNRKQAVQRQLSVERSLKRMKKLEEYNNNYGDAIKHGALSKVSNEELQQHKAKGGKVHYTGHHPVFKEASLSTPLRVVNDSALRNNWTGPSINNCSAKGPKALNNLMKIMLRWRSYEVAIILDLKKAYNTIKTG